MDKDLSDFLDKSIVVYFDDGSKVVRKTGTLKKVTDTYILIIEKNEPQMIFNNRIIRIKPAEEDIDAGGKDGN